MSCINTSVCKRQNTILLQSFDLTPKTFPLKTTLLFLSYLDHEYLEQVAQTKGWEQLAGHKRLWSAFNLQKLFPKLTIIDEVFWQTKRFSSLQINVSDIKPINGVDKRTMIPVLKRLSSQVEGNAGMTLLTIPQGLSFNKLVTFAESLIEQHGIIFGYIWRAFTKVFGNEKVNNTYRVVITNNVLLGSRDLTIQDQKDLVDNLMVGCEFPRAIEMVVLLISTVINSNTYLFNDNPRTYSRCQEIIDGWQLAAGGFSADGFQVDRSHAALKVFGVAGRRKFSP